MDGPDLTHTHTSNIAGLMRTTVKDQRQRVAHMGAPDLEHMHTSNIDGLTRATVKVDQRQRAAHAGAPMTLWTQVTSKVDLCHRAACASRAAHGLQVESTTARDPYATAPCHRSGSMPLFHITAREPCHRSMSPFGIHMSPRNASANSSPWPPSGEHHRLGYH